MGRALVIGPYSVDSIQIALLICNRIYTCFASVFVIQIKLYVCEHRESVYFSSGVTFVHGSPQLRSLLFKQKRSVRLSSCVRKSPILTFQKSLSDVTLWSNNGDVPVFAQGNSITLTCRMKLIQIQLN